MKTGHNRLRMHLHNIGLEDSNLCRLCDREQEDCCHLLVDCENALMKIGSKMMRLRIACGVLSLEDYYTWLFMEENEETHHKKVFLKLLEKVDIVL